MHLTLDEILDSLAAREAIYDNNFETMNDYWTAMVPEFSSEDRSILLAASMSKFTERTLSGMDPTEALMELFMRGVEIGREIERRANAA